MLVRAEIDQVAPVTRRARLSKGLRYVGYTVFVVLTDAYGVLTTLLLLGLLLLGGETLITGLFKSFFPAVLLPALVAVPGSALIRRWRLVVFSLPALLVFVVNYGVFFMPRSASVSPAAPQISLLTFNIHSERSKLTPIVAIIREASPDVVAFQELQPEASDYFAAEFAQDYPYRALHPGVNTVTGQGIFSRYPLSRDELWTILDRPAFQRVDITVQGRNVVLYNIHPHVPVSIVRGYNGDAHTHTMQEFLRRIEATDQPVIICGDLNMTDQYAGYRDLTDRYQDTHREIGWGLGLTFPDFGIIGLGMIPPLIRLDYVFHNDKVTGVAAQVWHTSGGFDHRPLFVRLALVG